MGEETAEDQNLPNVIYDMCGTAPLRQPNINHTKGWYGSSLHSSIKCGVSVVRGRTGGGWTTGHISLAFVFSNVFYCIQAEGLS